MTGDLDRHSLWQLLATITVRKALKQIERERTQKRGAGRVHAETDWSDATGTGGFRLDEVLGRMPTQEFDLQCEELLLQLTAELREIAVLRLMGYTNAEIAERLHCTERRIQRKLQLIRLKWEEAVKS
jgi:DNA-directed RNA polymerase specialized sigma24 family protein